MARLGFLWIAIGVGAGACSIVNAPDDVKPGGGGATQGGAGPTSTTDATGAMSGGGGHGGSVIPVCGNGAVEGDEECDDGDGSTPPDACSADCKITEWDLVKDPTYSNEFPGIGRSGTDGKEYFVVWRYKGIETNPDDDAIRGQAFKPDGKTLGQLLALSNPMGGPGPARIGTNGLGRSIVAWQSSSENNKVRYRVIEPDGTDSLDSSIDSKSVGLISVGASETNDFVLVWLQTTETPCCVSTPTPNCGIPSIETCVCAMDPYCCMTAWDSICVSEVDSLSCGATCTPVAHARAFDKNGSSFLTSDVFLGNAANASDYPGAWGEKDGFIASWNTPGGNLGSFKLGTDGVTIGAQFDLATGGTALNPSRNPFGAYVGPDQEFIAVYEQDLGGKHRIFKHAFTAAGNSAESGVVVSSVAHNEEESRVARHTNGRFVVVWTDDEPDAPDLTDTGQIMARVFQPDGTAIGKEFQVNTVKSGRQHWPGVAVNADGDAMFVWSNEENPTTFRISAKIYPNLMTK